MYIASMIEKRRSEPASTVQEKSNTAQSWVGVASLVALALSAACKDKAPSGESAAQGGTAQVAVDLEAAKACCMGLNECKGKGGCAVPESHACAGKNECKGKGGCNMHCPK
jgi:hypothetical protein